MSDPTQTTNLAWEQYVAVWVQSLASVIQQIAGKPCPYASVEAPPEGSPLTVDTDTWLLVKNDGGLRGEFAVRASSADATTMAQLLLGAPAAATETLTAEQKEAAEEFFRQVAGHAATALRALANEVQLHVETLPGAPTWSAASTTWLRAAPEAAGPHCLEIRCSAALSTALQTAATLMGTAAATAVAQAKATPPSAGTPPASGEAIQRPLDLLLDVPLELTLHFGQRRMLLREILELNSGSVLELNRRVQEPVEIKLDQRLLARGEVVVVDGHYGVRITEMAPATVAG